MCNRSAHSNARNHRRPPALATLPTALLVSVAVLGWAPGAQAFDFSAAGLNPALLRVSVFAEGLNYPVGMTELADGSILAAVTNGNNYFGASSGSLIRLVDTDGDGTADAQETLVDDVPHGKVTSVRRAGELIAVTGQGSGAPITLYRTGATPSAPLTQVGSIVLTYPSGGWLHPHSSLALRQTPGETDRYELYFQLGSSANWADTNGTVNLSSTLGLATRLVGDALHRIELFDSPTGLTATGLTHIATGLRNATGIEFHPVTGDLFLGDNGIDGLVNPNEPFSADEINLLPAGLLGSQVVDFGFPSTYIEYRTGEVVGDTGHQPIAAFQPIPLPDGEEAEGVNEIAFSPPMFPAGLNNGIFAGFHGKWAAGGLANEENPLAFVDLETGEVQHVVGVDEPNVGHLDGLLATTRTLYVSDISPGGGFSSGGTGRIYAITSLIVGGDFERDGDVDGGDLLLWQRQMGESTGRFRGADANGDAVVDGDDLGIWATAFGHATPTAGLPVPEPTAGVLVGLMTLVLAVRQSRRG